MSDASAPSDGMQLLREELDRFQAELQRVYVDRVQALGEAKGADEKAAAARRLAPGPLKRELKAVLIRVEEWYRAWHDRAVMEVAAECAVAPGRWLLPAAEQGWLQFELSDAIGAFTSVLDGLRTVGEASASLTRSAAPTNATVNRALADAAGTLKDTAKLSRVLGEMGRTMRRAGEIHGALDEAMGRLDEAAETFHRAFDETVVRRIDTRLLADLSAIRAARR